MHFKFLHCTEVGNFRKVKLALKKLSKHKSAHFRHFSQPLILIHFSLVKLELHSHHELNVFRKKSYFHNLFSTEVSVVFSFDSREL